jgi:hypothetical protein
MKNLFFKYLLAFVLLLEGCTSTKVFNPEHLENDNEENITVYLKDGRIIRYGSGDYTYVNLGNGMIRGTGKLITNKLTGEFVVFEEAVSFDEIEKVEITETTLVGQITIIVILSGVIAFALLLILLSQLSFKT